MYTYIKKEKLAELSWAFFLAHWVVHGSNIIVLVRSIKSNLLVIYVATHIVRWKKCCWLELKSAFFLGYHLPPKYFLGTNPLSPGTWGSDLPLQPSPGWLLFVWNKSLSCYEAYLAYFYSPLPSLPFISLGIVFNLEQIFESGSCSCSLYTEENY